MVGNGKSKRKNLFNKNMLQKKFTNMLFTTHWDKIHFLSKNETFDD